MFEQYSPIESGRVIFNNEDFFSIKKSKSYFLAFPWVNRQISVNPKIIEIITEKITFVNKVVIEL